MASLPNWLLLGLFEWLSCNWFLCGSESVEWEEEDPNEVINFVPPWSSEDSDKCIRVAQVQKGKGTHPEWQS